MASRTTPQTKAIRKESAHPPSASVRSLIAIPKPFPRTVFPNKDNGKDNPRNDVSTTKKGDKNYGWSGHTNTRNVYKPGAEAGESQREGLSHRRAYSEPQRPIVPRRNAPSNGRRRENNSTNNPQPFNSVRSYTVRDFSPENARNFSNSSNLLFDYPNFGDMVFRESLPNVQFFENAYRKVFLYMQNGMELMFEGNYFKSASEYQKALSLMDKILSTKVENIAHDSATTNAQAAMTSSVSAKLSSPTAQGAPPSYTEVLKEDIARTSLASLSSSAASEDVLNSSCSELSSTADLVGYSFGNINIDSSTEQELFRRQSLPEMRRSRPPPIPPRPLLQLKNTPNVTSTNCIQQQPILQLDKSLPTSKRQSIVQFEEQRNPLEKFKNNKSNGVKLNWQVNFSPENEALERSVSKSKVINSNADRKDEFSLFNSPEDKLAGSTSLNYSAQNDAWNPIVNKNKISEQIAEDRVVTSIVDPFLFEDPFRDSFPVFKLDENPFEDLFHKNNSLLKTNNSNNINMNLCADYHEPSQNCLSELTIRPPSPFKDNEFEVDISFEKDIKEVDKDAIIPASEEPHEENIASVLQSSVSSSPEKAKKWQVNRLKSKSMASIFDDADLEVESYFENLTDDHFKRPVSCDVLACLEEEEDIASEHNINNNKIIDNRVEAVRESLLHMFDPLNVSDKQIRQQSNSIPEIVKDVQVNKLDSENLVPGKSRNTAFTTKEDPPFEQSFSNKTCPETSWNNSFQSVESGKEVTVGRSAFYQTQNWQGLPPNAKPLVSAKGRNFVAILDLEDSVKVFFVHPSSSVESPNARQSLRVFKDISAPYAKQRLILEVGDAMWAWMLNKVSACVLDSFGLFVLPGPGDINVGILLTSKIKQSELAKLRRILAAYSRYEIEKHIPKPTISDKEKTKFSRSQSGVTKAVKEKVERFQTRASFISVKSKRAFSQAEKAVTKKIQGMAGIPAKNDFVYDDTPLPPSELETQALQSNEHKKLQESAKRIREAKERNEVIYY